MTKYILAGGMDRQTEDFGRKLAKEVYKTVNRPARILSCFFADPENEWRHKASYWEEWFKDYFGSDMQYNLATLEAVIPQIKLADVIYLHGGDSNELIVERMKAFPDIARTFEGKVVIGSSAGANYLSRKFWTRSKRQVMDGSGIVPYGVMVHYGSVDGGFGAGTVDWPNAEQAVREAIGSDTKLLKIHESEFVVVET